MTQVAIFLFDGITALDAVGPYEVLQRLPGTEVVFVGLEPGVKYTEEKNLGLEASRSIDEVPAPDIVLIPGGLGTRNLMHDERVLAWVRAAHETSRWTTSVCTGSLILAGAGLLRGVEATSHWLALDLLREQGAIPVEDRVVRRGKIITAAGVSSGIDMALQLVELESNAAVAQAVQLSIEYDPQPPHDAGSPKKAPQAVVEMVRRAAKGNSR